MTNSVSRAEAATKVRAILICDARYSPVGWQAILGARIAGHTLLARHLLSYRVAGVTQITVAGLLETAATGPLPDIPFDRVPAWTRTGVSEDASEAVIEHDADLLVDPRLIRELAARGRSVVCVDRHAGQHAVGEKSPYHVGVPYGREDPPVETVETLDADLTPIGIAMHAASTSANLDVCRFYWHRVAGDADAATATTKVLLATMKPTDGMYARTNRRVSLRISRPLLDTFVTPNMVTFVSLLLGLAAGGLFTVGTRFAMVSAAVLAWTSSMIDGVDGELARARFQSSDLGRKLDVFCADLLYPVMLLGLGVGVARLTGERWWGVVGVAAAAGACLTSLVASRLKRRHRRMTGEDDFVRHFQSSLDRRTDPILVVLRHCQVLATWAAWPYYMVLFAVLNLSDIFLALSCVGAQGWLLALYAAPQLRPQPSAVPASSQKT